MRALAFATIAVTTSVGFLPTAFADESPATASLSWVREEGASSCPDALAMAHAVSDHLGRTPFGADARQFIEATVEHRGLEWSVHLYVRDASGALIASRTLTSDADTCATIANATAIALAVAIDPDFAIREASAAPSSAPSPAPPRETPIERPVAPSPPRTAARHAYLESTVTVRAIGALGMLPGPSGAIGIAADVFSSGRLSVSLGGTFFPEVQATEDGGRYGYLLAMATATPCLVAIRTEHLSLAACAGLALGDIHASVYNTQPSQPGDRIWIAGLAGARFRFGIVGPLVGEIGIDAVVPVTSYRFYDAGDNVTLFQQAAVVGTAYSGLGVRFR